MSAHNVIGAAEGLIGAAAASIALGGRQAAPTYVQSTRAIQAVGGLMDELDRERAAVTALKIENAELRSLAESLLARLMRTQSVVEVLERQLQARG